MVFLWKFHNYEISILLPRSGAPTNCSGFAYLLCYFFTYVMKTRHVRNSRNRMVHSGFVEFRFCEMLGSHVCYDTRAFASPLCAVDLIKVKSSVGLLADYRPDSFSAKTGSILNNGDARADARTEGGQTDRRTDWRKVSDQYSSKNWRRRIRFLLLLSARCDFQMSDLRADFHFLTHFFDPKSGASSKFVSVLRSAKAPLNLLTLRPRGRDRGRARDPSRSASAPSPRPLALPAVIILQFSEFFFFIVGEWVCLFADIMFGGVGLLI